MKDIIKCYVIDGIENVFATRCEGVTSRGVVEGKIGHIDIDSDRGDDINGVRIIVTLRLGFLYYKFSCTVSGE